MVLLNAGSLKMRALNVDSAERRKLQIADGVLKDYTKSLKKLNQRKKLDLNELAKQKRKKMLDKMKEELEIKR